jgi:hypothetical protein
MNNVIELATATISSLLDVQAQLLAQLERLQPVVQHAGQEPVAWMVTTERYGKPHTYPVVGDYDNVVNQCDYGNPVPLYTHPQPAVPEGWDEQWPDYARKDGMLRIPVSELRRWRNVFASEAHPHESPYAKDIDALLSAGKEVSDE